ncbi:hypothetical protein P691DRAFT_213585 [Macrolepiota fuliginosa MF-IS2]|uniref:Uncharacterized protein n=1 Tax=Macrolepiota fuliginosa MF-IS2 TaxID=1400762 RepID=A0A9P6C086_9AGAR|nr:hypothetical protein P691DRAFT_213585 [Macrolepiota fuliginosa MF-IS2]
MKMHKGILSQSLRLTRAEKDTYVQSDSVDIRQEIDVAPDTEKLACFRNGGPFILGNRAFGLVGALEDGSEKTYLKPAVIVGRIVTRG